MKAPEIAAMAADLVSGDRDRVHGAKGKNFADIAAFWTTYLQRRFPGFTGVLDGTDAALMGDLLKTARTVSGKHNPDDYVDKAGYAACAGEIAGRERA